MQAFFNSTFRMPLLAFVHIGDTPGWMLLFGVFLCPIHLGLAFGFLHQGWASDGYGPAAALIQGMLLLLLFASFPFAIRLKEIPLWLRTAYLPVGYPFITFLTNLAPAVAR